MTPMRRCIGCRQSRPQSELMRFTAGNGSILADIEGKREGRGIYLCRDSECVAKAFRNKAFNRILRSAVQKDVIEEEIERALRTS